MLNATFRTNKSRESTVEQRDLTAKNWKSKLYKNNSMIMKMFGLPFSRK
jgi:hypothetical protein